MPAEEHDRGVAVITAKLLHMSSLEAARGHLLWSSVHKMFKACERFDTFHSSDLL
jgi:hypothetical protein